MSKIIRGYRYQIYPTNEQAKQLDTFTNLFRKVYNWGIETELKVYEQYKQGLSKYGFYTDKELYSLLTIERNKPENEWLRELPMCTGRLALRNVYHAFKSFFKQKSNFPRFKSKKHSKLSFNTRNDRFSIKNDSIRIEGFKTRISLGFESRLNFDKVIDPVISKDTLGNYYVSFSLEEESKELDIPKTEGIGIDLGDRRTFTLSTGEIYNQPKEKLDKLERKSKIQQRHVTRDRKRREAEAKRTIAKYEDIPKSKRAIKRELRLNKIYKKIHNIKDTFYHTITKQIVMRNPKFVCMETFSVTQIQKREPYSSQYLYKTSFYDITQKMKDKCNTYNIPFIQAPIDYPSTKMCNNCGHVKNMNSKHVYKCPNCGMVEDRDINAAINLMNYGSQFI